MKKTTLENQFVVVDIDGFPYMATMSQEEDTSKERMVKLGPEKPWDYYEKKGHTVEQVDIQIIRKN